MDAYHLLDEIAVDTAEKIADRARLREDSDQRVTPFAQRTLDNETPKRAEVCQRSALSWLSIDSRFRWVTEVVFRRCGESAPLCRELVGRWRAFVHVKSA